MFAIAINRCDRAKQAEAASLALNLMLYDTTLEQRSVFAAWGAPSEKWVAWQSRRHSTAAVLRRFSASLVRSRRLIVGSHVESSLHVSRDGALVRDDGNEISVETTKLTAVLSVRRGAARTLWLGWYRDEGIDIVLAHPSRNAMEAATGRCGCLFDEHLQLWLVEKRRAAWYELGSRLVSKSEVHEDGD